MLTDIQRLEQRITRLEGMMDQNNFSALQVYGKSIEVKGFIVLKEYASDPTPAREGTLAYVNGKLKLCTVGGSTPTWVVVGTQT